MRYRGGVVVAFPDGPKMKLAKNAADRAFRELAPGYTDAVCTSQHEGNHSAHSMHYARLDDSERYPNNPSGSQGAIDLRTWPLPWVWGQMLPAKKKALADRWRELLEEDMPGEWYVLVESDHLHGHHLVPRKRRGEIVA